MEETGDFQSLELIIIKLPIEFAKGKPAIVLIFERYIEH